MQPSMRRQIRSRTRQRILSEQSVACRWVEFRCGFISFHCVPLRCMPLRVMIRYEMRADKVNGELSTVEYEKRMARNHERCTMGASMNATANVRAEHVPNAHLFTYCATASRWIKKNCSRQQHKFLRCWLCFRIS
mmetsp:Transcript_11101/g.30672  ORF Transcript_11101/g.30672 Transcript_11101/m.30672 type:complete len:135 (+) Transcript_11101:725-1129(+)